MEGCLGIVVGVTGHRDLRQGDIPALTHAVTAFFEELARRCPHTPVTVMSSLAQGADTLCARVALGLGLPVVCPLPMEKDAYINTFSPQNREEFLTVLEQAGGGYVIPQNGPAPENEEAAFRAAGLYIAENCHILLSLWDGTPPTPRGCGTDEAVDFALNPAGRLLSPGAGAAVYWVQAPRESRPAPCASAPGTAAWMEGTPGTLGPLLARTESMNKACAGITPGAGLVDEALLATLDKGLRRVDRVYRAADGLALQARSKHRHSLAVHGLLGSAMVLAYLLYDELSAKAFLPLYAVLLALALWVHLRTEKGGWHRLSLEYRALAETLRTGFFLTACGAGADVWQYASWGQKQEAPWLRFALTGIWAGPPPAPASAPMAALWAEGQQAYHERAVKKTGLLLAGQTRLTTLLALASVAVVLCALVLEFFFPAAASALVPGMGLPHFPGGAEAVTVRSFLKILMGGFPAVTLFLSAYFGKQSLPQKLRGYRRMAALYALAARTLKKDGADPATLQALAREEVLENGEWLGYSLDDTADLSL